MGKNTLGFLLKYIAVLLLGMSLAGCGTQDSEEDTGNAIIVENVDNISGEAVDPNDDSNNFIDEYVAAYDIVGTWSLNDKEYYHFYEGGTGAYEVIDSEGNVSLSKFVYTLPDEHHVTIQYEGFDSISEYYYEIPDERLIIGTYTYYHVNK